MKKIALITNFNIPDTIGGCRFEIYGTKGCITAERTIGQTETGEVRYCMFERPEDGFKELGYVSGNMYTKEIDGFSLAVLKDTTVPVTAEEGIFNQRIVEAVYESQKKRVHISMK